MDIKKKNHILRTATSMFDRNGFHNTPTSKIAKQAGVSVGTLFNYFESKEELIKEIYINIKNSIAEHVSKSYQPSDDFDSQLKSIWKAMITWGMENPEDFEFIEQFSNSPYFNQIKHHKAKEYFAEFKEKIKTSFCNTTLWEKYPEYSMIYIGNLYRGITKYLIENEQIDRDEFIGLTFDLFWKDTH